jgi:hypothetical protein
MEDWDWKEKPWHQRFDFAHLVQHTGVRRLDIEINSDFLGIDVGWVFQLNFMLQKAREPKLKVNIGLVICARESRDVRNDFLLAWANLGWSFGIIMRPTIVSITCCQARITCEPDCDRDEARRTREMVFNSGVSPDECHSDGICYRRTVWAGRTDWSMKDPTPERLNSETEVQNDTQAKRAAKRALIRSRIANGVAYRLIG